MELTCNVGSVKSSLEKYAALPYQSWLILVLRRCPDGLGNETFEPETETFVVSSETDIGMSRDHKPACVTYPSLAFVRLGKGHVCLCFFLS